MAPASGDAHKNLHFPHGGIRSRADNSASGNATKILHPRKRRFVIISSVPVPAWGNAPTVVHPRKRKCEGDAASPLRESASGCVLHIKRSERIVRLGAAWAGGWLAASGAGFCRQNLGIKYIPCVGTHLLITMAAKSALSYCQIYWYEYK